VNMALKYTQNCASASRAWPTISSHRETPRSTPLESKQFKSCNRARRSMCIRVRNWIRKRKSVALADAYDLNARIQAAMGKLGPALRDLDSASIPYPGAPRPRRAKPPTTIIAP